MHIFRLRYTALGLLIYLQSAFSLARPNGADFDDIPSRTARAAVVFEGRSHREARIPEMRGFYNVRFKVLQIYKGHLLPANGSTDSAPIVTVGRFRTSTDSEKNCSHAAPRLQMESRYIVFLADNANRTEWEGKGDERETSTAAASESLRTDDVLRMSDCPEPVSLQVSRQVRRNACAKCAQTPRIIKISDTKEVTTTDRVRLHCRSSGKPRPEITWYKDGVRIRKTKRLSLKQHKQSSLLQIRKVDENDSGLYECQAANGLGRTERVGTRVVVLPGSTKQHSEFCSSQDYCLNGGTCYFIAKLNKNFCVCSKKFDGLRCEEKFSNPGRGKKKRSSPSSHK